MAEREAILRRAMAGAGEEELSRAMRMVDAIVRSEEVGFLDGGTKSGQGTVSGGGSGLQPAHDRSAGGEPTGAHEVGLDAPGLSKPGPYELGPYELGDVIGEGGFSTVRAARQRFPVERDVAIKLLKPGLETREVLARFAAERQLLAVLDHPNIATIFDAGATPQGRPYFVMELVRGKAITAHCDEALLGVRARLGLFVQVCRAIQHAHSKGVIHRDIKAGNALVTQVDGEPVVKVIDFGIAKAIQSVGAPSDVTTERQVLGTPATMSPEQARGSQDIDTRADVYALGALLYELLCGERVFDGDRLRALPMDEVLRIVQQEDPVRPSVRCGASARAGEIARARGTSTAELSRTLRTDLDWIVMRCLEKDRARRYDSVGDLARDIERYQRDEPVEATPPSVMYRVRKAGKRHKVAIVAGGVVLASLLLGLGGAVAGMVKANREKDLAQQAQQQEARAKEAAKTQARKADRVGRFLTDVLQGADPSGGQGRDARVADMLDDAAAHVNMGDLKDDPEVESAVRAALGLSYGALNEKDKALAQLNASVEATARDGASVGQRCNALAARADVLSYLSMYADAERDLREAIAIMEREQPGDSEDLARLLRSLSVTINNAGRIQEGTQVSNRALEMLTRLLGPDALEVIRLRLDTGVTTHGMPNLELLRQAVASAEREFGPNHVHTARMEDRLAGALMMSGDRVGAYVTYEAATNSMIGAYGESHPQAFMQLLQQAFCCSWYGDSQRLRPLAQRVVDMGSSIPSLQHHIGISHAYAYLGQCDRSEQKFADAIVHFRATISTLPPDAPPAEFAANESRLAWVLLTQGQGEEALRVAESALARRVPEGFWTVPAATGLRGHALLLLGRLDEASRDIEASHAELVSKGQYAQGNHRGDSYARMVKLYEALLAREGEGPAKDTLREKLEQLRAEQVAEEERIRQGVAKQQAAQEKFEQELAARKAAGSSPGSASGNPK